MTVTYISEAEAVARSVAALPDPRGWHQATLVIPVLGVETPVVWDAEGAEVDPFVPVRYVCWDRQRRADGVWGWVHRETGVARWATEWGDAQ